MFDVDALGRHEAELLREEAARIADTETALQSVLDGDVLVPLVTDREARPRLAGTDHRGSVRRRIAILVGVAAAVVAIALVATRDDDATPADQPSPTVTLPATSPPQALPEWVAPPLGPPIECEPELCPWSPELTAHVMSPAIRCDMSTGPRCPSIAVSPDGTLVAYDHVARTLTWYEDEPRVVSLTAELGHGLTEIGPHDVAYFHIPGNWIVAVAPSGAEITRTQGSNASEYPTAAGLVQFHSGGGSSHQCLSASAAPPIPWVDPDGNPITDTRPYPTATATDAGIEIRLGERKWLLADEEAGRTPGRLECLDFRPRSDGGVVIVVPSFAPSDVDRVTVLELLPDGTIERYFIAWGAKVLPDGSMVVGHMGELVRLTPPA